VLYCLGRQQLNAALDDPGHALSTLTSRYQWLSQTRVSIPLTSAILFAAGLGALLHRVSEATSSAWPYVVGGAVVGASLSWLVHRVSAGVSQMLPPSKLPRMYQRTLSLGVVGFGIGFVGILLAFYGVQTAGLVIVVTGVFLVAFSMVAMLAQLAWSLLRRFI